MELPATYQPSFLESFGAVLFLLFRAALLVFFVIIILRIYKRLGRIEKKLNGLKSSNETSET